MLSPTDGERQRHIHHEGHPDPPRHPSTPPHGCRRILCLNVPHVSTRVVCINACLMHEAPLRELHRRYSTRRYRPIRVPHEGDHHVRGPRHEPCMG
jgi:hypothetical protein